MAEIKVGLIGAGFIGRSHARAFHAVATVFPDIPAVGLEMLAEATRQAAAAAAAELRFRRWTADWRQLAADPEVDLVAIATPNHLHREMALAAIAAGRHVYCEKPLARDAAEARGMAEAAAAAGVKTLVGYGYLCNPAIRLAREILEGGDIGEVVHFRGAHGEDYLADPATPFSWRCARAQSGSGALADLGSHVISLAHYLVGEVEAVCADLATVIPERTDPATGALRAVENDDQVQFLIRFAGGATGSAEASRVAHGRKLGLGFEITGTKGALRFDQERMNELAVYEARGAAGRRGFRTILTGPEHPYYAAFCPAPGHGLGFNDLKLIEVYRLLSGLDGTAPLYPDFHDAAKIAQVIDAVLRAAEEGRWVTVAEV